MPYTRNTRIKIVKHKHHTQYIAEVEYVYPILGIKVWEEIAKVEPNILQVFDVYEYPLPWRAYRDCMWDEDLRDTKGEQWAKALIDQYHKLYDEAEYKPVVEYIKYPE